MSTVEIRDAMLASAHAKSVETEDWRDGRGVCAMARFVVNGITMSLEIREYPAENKSGVDYLLETLPTEDFTSDYLEAYGIYDDVDDWKFANTLNHLRKVRAEAAERGERDALQSMVHLLAPHAKKLTRAQAKAAQDAALDAMAK